MLTLHLDISYSKAWPPKEKNDGLLIIVTHLKIKISNPPLAMNMKLWIILVVVGNKLLISAVNQTTRRHIRW